MVQEEIVYIIKNKAYKVTAVDGSGEMVKLASNLLKQKVLHMNFENLKLDNKYRGICAFSSLLYVKRSNLISILNYLGQLLEKD